MGGGGEDGELATHVEAVPDGSLAAVVLTGMDVTADPPAFQRLVARLGGTARMVIVVSEAPWWWSRRVGTEITDLAPRRPPTPETWIEALTGAGFSATAVYGPDGRTFCRGGAQVKLGLVVPRYGTEVIGGTEHWLRALFEHLVARKGWEAEVFTTCAQSAATWDDYYPPGDYEIDGVRVHRHRSRSGRDARYLHTYAGLRADPGGVSEREARRFVELVGPVCPEAVEEAEASDCDLVAVTPYLYWTSIEAVEALGRRVVFHGAAHDEAEFHLPIMRRVFEAVGGFS